MAIIVPNEGERFMLDTIREPGDFDGFTFYCGLFKSDTTPDDDTVFSDLTLADFSGYDEIAVTWGAVQRDGTGKAYIEGEPVTFTHDGGGTDNNIYGSFVAADDGVDTILITVERYSDAPRAIDDDGDSITVTPTLRLFHPSIEAEIFEGVFFTTDDYLTGVTDDLQPANISIAWYGVPHTVGPHAIIQMVYDPDNLGVDPFESFALYTHSTTGPLAVVTVGGTQYLAEAGTPITTEEAHWLILTYDGTDLKIFVDDDTAEDTTDTGGGNIDHSLNPTGAFGIGASDLGDDNFAEATFQRLLIWNRALTDGADSEVTQILDGNISAAGNLIADWNYTSVPLNANDPVPVWTDVVNGIEATQDTGANQPVLRLD